MLTPTHMPRRQDARPAGIFLRGNDVRDLDQVPALVFGHLADLCAPVLQAFRSDLYHDAVWLQQNLTGQAVSFFFAYTDSSTFIGVDERLARLRQHVFKVTAFIVDGSAYLHLEQLPGGRW